jgi:hypothetical protein
MQPGTGRPWMIADLDGARPATNQEIFLAFLSATVPLNEAKLRIYPSRKQLQKQQQMLDRRMDALMEGLCAVTKPHKALRKQIGGKLIEINGARDQLFWLEMERLDLERHIEACKTILRDAVARYQKNDPAP